MPNPGSLGGVAPRGLDYLHRKVADQQKQIDQLMTQRTLESAIVGRGGLTIQGGTFTLKALDGTVLSVLDATGVTIVGDLILNGTETVSGDIVSADYVAATSGFKFTGATGNAEFNDLNLRGGIIGDDALANPLKTDFYTDTSGGYALTIGSAGGWVGTATVRASVTITIPDGFTTLTLFATAQDSGRNTSGSTSSIGSCINVGAPGADYSTAYSSDVEAGQGAISLAIMTDNLTGLTGGDTVSVQSRPFSNSTGWVADPYNGTSLQVLAFFFR